MHTNIYLGVLAAKATCEVLPLSNYPQGLSSSEYSVTATQVPSQTLASANSAGNFFTGSDGNSFLMSGVTQILSVSRDVGIKEGDDYVLNIPLQLSGDDTVFFVQLQLWGTADDSNAWFGSKCSPQSGEWTIDVPHYGNVTIQQQGAWNSDWYAFADSDGAYSETLVPVPPDISPVGIGSVGPWSWYSGSAGAYYSLYLIDVPSAWGSNDDLYVMITDWKNDPNYTP